VSSQASAQQENADHLRSLEFEKVIGQVFLVINVPRLALTIKTTYGAGPRQFESIVPGVFTPVLAKHSKSFSLIDCISVGVDRMQRNFEPMQADQESLLQSRCEVQ
jgi:hypothetical protein